MRRKIRFRVKRTPKGYSAYVRGGTKYRFGKWISRARAIIGY